MAKLASTARSILLAFFLAACVLPGFALKPGDKIGDSVITNQWEEGIKNFNEICTFDELVDATCQIPASLTKIGISIGWAEPTQEELEQAWLDSEWKMTVDDKPVDIEAFGTFDMDWEGLKARVWNVFLVNPALGKHTVRYDMYFPHGSRIGNHTEIYVFTVVAEQP